MILLTSDAAIFHKAVAAGTFLQFDIVTAFFDAARGTLICRLLFCAAHDVYYVVVLLQCCRSAQDQEELPKSYKPRRALDDPVLSGFRGKVGDGLGNLAVVATGGCVSAAGTVAL